MFTALDAPPDALDEHEKAFVENIKKHGWFRTNVFGDEEGPAFSYSTGFWVNTGHPELIMFGMKSETAHDVFWELFRDAKKGEKLVAGNRTEAAFANLPAYAFLVARRHYAAHLGWSRWFYGSDEFLCLQIVWPDRAGVFPWEDGFDAAFVGDQPDLTEHGWANEVAD